MLVALDGDVDGDDGDKDTRHRGYVTDGGDPSHARDSTTTRQMFIMASLAVFAVWAGDIGIVALAVCAASILCRS